MIEDEEFTHEDDDCLDDEEEWAFWNDKTYEDYDDDQDCDDCPFADYCDPWEAMACKGLIDPWDI